MRIKKAVFIFLLLFLTICAFGQNCISVQAGTTEKAEDELWGIVIEQIDILDLEALQEYIDTLENFDTVNIKEQIIGYIKGESIDYQSFSKMLLQVVFSKAVDLLPAFACIMAITLLSGLISMLGSPSNGATVSNAISMITYVSALIPLLVVLIECFSPLLQSKH